MYVKFEFIRVKADEAWAWKHFLYNMQDHDVIYGGIVQYNAESERPI